MNKAGRTWATKTDDYFPYAHHPHGFWTGYFTSRPALKYYERRSNNILQVTRQLNAFANVNLRNKTFPLSKKFTLKTLLYIVKTLFTIGEALGIAQHHDAVSGTEKQEVAFDYAMRLSEGIDPALVSSQK